MNSEQPSADTIKYYVQRNIGRMTKSQMAEALGVSEYIVSRFMPAAAR